LTFPPPAPRPALSCWPNARAHIFDETAIAIMDLMDPYELDRADARGVHSPRGLLDALARADLLSGDPALDRRFAALADADPLGLRIPRRASAFGATGSVRDTASPERQAYSIPMPVGADGGRRKDPDA
jgi:hypothetical protein